VSIKIVPMGVDDLKAVLEIENLSFPIPWSRNSFLSELFENERAVYLVAKDPFDRLLGYIGMWKVFDEGHITNLAVHPGFRQQGVGRILLEALTRYARSEAIKFLTLEVRRSNEPAQQLYYQQGFVHMGVRRKYYLDNNEDALIMWKGPI
jgi:ribosomal-protein-alanine N-acetyltransferase